MIRLLFGYSPSGDTIDLEDHLLAGALVVEPGFDLASSLEVAGLASGDSATVQLDGDQVVVMPEPGRVALLCAGIGALAWLNPRRRAPTARMEAPTPG